MKSCVYQARGIRVWPAGSGSAVPESVTAIAEFARKDRTEAKRQALLWIIDMIRAYPADADFYECWNDDPDDAWKIRVPGNMEHGAEQVMAELDLIGIAS